MRFLIVAAMAACVGGVAMAAEIKSVTDKAVVQLETKDWQSARCWICTDPTYNGTKPR